MENVRKLQGGFFVTHCKSKVTVKLLKLLKLFVLNELKNECNSLADLVLLNYKQRYTVEGTSNI